MVVTKRAMSNTSFFVLCILALLAGLTTANTRQKTLLDVTDRLYILDKDDGTVFD